MEPLKPGDPAAVGTYRLLRRLGDGGMGVVYLGVSPLGERVAVKVIRDQFANDPEYRARFRREITAAATVAGMFTASLVAFDADADSPWLATTYLPGMTLRAAVARFGALPVDGVWTLASGLAEALDAIHRAGVAHRDLKPDNVMLTSTGPQVVDFGIARQEDATAVTRVGRMLGTPGYMAPEQITGTSTGKESDVFSFGAVLAYTATGREPFGTGDTTDRLRRTLHNAPDLEGLRDSRLADLITDCLQPDWQRRPSASELLRRLGTPPVLLHGTRWLPGSVAAEVDRRTTQARELFEPEPAPPSTRAVPIAAVMAAPTLDPYEEVSLDLVAEPEPHVAIVDGSRRMTRRALLGTAAAVGALAVGGAVWWRSTDATPAATTPRPPRSSSPAAGRTPRATMRWHTPVGDIYPDLDVAGGVVVAWADERVLALDPATGQIRWSRQKVDRGTAVGDVVYVVVDTVQSVGITYYPWALTAVQAATGATLWTHRPERWRPGRIIHYDFPISGPAVTGGVAVFGHGRVQAVNASTGRARWTAQVGAQHDLTAGGNVVVALNEVAMVGLDAGSGRTRWTYRIDEAREAVMADGVVFASDRGNVLHAVRADTGAVVWRRHHDGAGWGLRCGNGMVFVPGQIVSAFHAATGELVWSRRFGNGEGLSYGYTNVLSVFGDTMYVGSSDRAVYAVDATTGAVRWTYPVELTLDTPPVAIGETVFVGTRDGSVHAVAAPS